MTPQQSRWLLTTLLAFAGCGTDSPNNSTANQTTAPVNADDRDGDGILNDDELARGTDPDNPDTDGDGRLDGSEIELGTDPVAADGVCTEDRYSADFRFRPVDIIITIDNSGSMREEIEAVEQNINDNLAKIVDDAGIDFRVVLIGKHGEGTSFDSDICVAAPLSGTACDPVPDAPANTDRFFHVDVEVSSDDAFRRTLETYSQWSSQLRTDAFKAFVVVTDDESGASIGGQEPTAENFDAQLLALPGGQFGAPGSRNYVFHTIAGLEANSNPLEVWPASAGIVTTQCATAQSPGLAYQQLSIVTGGVRFPVCEFASYDGVFRAIAQGIVEDAQIDCSMRLPRVGEQQLLDGERMVLEFTRESGQPARVVTKVDSAARCGESNFYLTETTIELCPALCEQAKASGTGELVVFAECNLRLCDNPTTEICDDGLDNDCDGFADRQDTQCIL